MNNGLLHLRDVRPLASREDFLERNLGLAIREATGTDHGRMVTLEEQSRRLLSFFPVNLGMALVRVADVDDKGKSFAAPGFRQALYLAVYHRVSKFADIFTEGDLFEFHYTPALFIDTDYLYVPNNDYVHNMFVVFHHKPKK